MKRLVKKVVGRLGYSIHRTQNGGGRWPIIRPMDRSNLDILDDPDFQASCRMLSDTTLLDTPRLANLWTLCRMTDPAGAMAEIGVYRGGGSLHLSNCCPKRRIIVCDPFSNEGFEELDPKLDGLFYNGLFPNRNESAVRELLSKRNALIIKGFFPKSVEAVELPKISFVHLDVDAYKAMRESLFFLLTGARLLFKSLIVVDDFNRRAPGVNKAVAEIQSAMEGTLAFPMFPGQVLIVPSTWHR